MQSPSWEANWFAASQEIPRISRNPKVRFRTNKRPSPVSILGQPNPVHIPTSQLLEIHPNIIHPSTPRCPQWSLSLRFPQQDPIHPLSSPIRATCPAHRTTRWNIVVFDYMCNTQKKFFVIEPTQRGWRTSKSKLEWKALVLWRVCTRQHISRKSVDLLTQTRLEEQICLY